MLLIKKCIAKTYFRSASSKRRRLIVILLLVLWFYFIACSMRLQVTVYKIKSDKVENPVRIVLVTDTHSSYYKEGQHELLDLIDKQNPDVVLLSGDIIDDWLPRERGYKIVEGIAKKHKTYYVSGNHEAWTGDIDEIKERIRQYGVKILEGEEDTINLNGNDVKIIGIDDPDAGKRRYKAELKTLQNTDDTNLTLFMAHRPERYDDYNTVPHDIVFCGHAHGGQWRIPIIGQGIFAPDQGIFPKYTAGVHKFERGVMVISRGLSLESPPNIPRIFNRPELVVVDVIKR